MAIEGERIERKVEVEIVFFNFLNGHAKAFAPFLTDFFRDAALLAALLERVEDAFKEVSVDLGMMEKGGQTTHLHCATQFIETRAP